MNIKLKSGKVYHPIQLLTTFYEDVEFAYYVENGCVNDIIVELSNDNLYLRDFRCIGSLNLSAMIYEHPDGYLICIFYSPLANDLGGNDSDKVWNALFQKYNNFTIDMKFLREQSLEVTEKIFSLMYDTIASNLMQGYLEL